MCIGLQTKLLKDFTFKSFLNYSEQYIFKLALKTPEYFNCEQNCTYLVYSGTLMLFLNLFSFVQSNILIIILRNAL